MTIDANHFPMQARQLVGRVVIVIEERALPFVAAVAALAFAAVMLLMGIVLTVTSIATRIQLVIERRVRMAVGALQFCVFVLQWKSGIANVIEARIVPVARIVAALTLFPTVAVMGVIRLMASVASRRCADKRVISVTVEACRFLMLTKQREVCRAVIEARNTPLSRFMACAAIFAECFCMWRVFQMTGDAVRRCLAIFLVFRVAVFTQCVEMRAIKGEIG